MKLTKYWPAAASLLLIPFTAPTAFAQSDAEADDQRLDEITVTGRNREEFLQDIPVSISVISSSLLAELNVLR
jgi:outer membrane receptor protein involved in Fe transport